MRIVSWQEDYTQIAVQAMRTLGFQVEHLALDDIGAQRRLGQYDWDLAPMSSGPRADIFLRYVRLMSDGPNPVLWGGIQDATSLGVAARYGQPASAGCPSFRSASSSAESNAPRPGGRPVRRCA